jgi:hypothetical protein
VPEAQCAKPANRQRILVVACSQSNGVFEGQPKCLGRLARRLVHLCEKPVGKWKISRKSDQLEREVMGGLRVKPKEQGTEEWIH